MDMEVQEIDFYNKVLIDWFNKNNKYNKLLIDKIMNDYIKTLITANKDASANVKILEDTIKNYSITDEKSKANFGNLCVLLNGFRDVVNATDCLLINENVLKDDNGDYYKKIEEHIVPPTTKSKGSDFDIDKDNHE